MSNAPDRFESFLLGDGEKKIEIEIDTRVANCNIFHFKKEDHTLGDSIRAQLFKNPRVTFSGYIVPHPLFPDFDLRVQTDGSISPREAVTTACRELVRLLELAKQQFTKEWEIKKISKTHDGVDGARDGLNGIGY